MKKYSAPEVVFDKFTTEEIAIIGDSADTGENNDIGADLNFGDLT